MARIKPILPFLGLALAVLVAYSGILHGEFVLDDEFLLVKNEFLRSWEHFFTIFATSSTGGALGTDAFYRPVQGVLYLLVFQLAGLSPVAFHLLNLILHAANACLLWTLGCRLGFAPRWCWFAALLWALHPIHTEAVAYMSATADPAYTLSCLLGLGCLLPDFSAARTAVASLLFLVALLCKESAIVFPALATICLWFTRPEGEKWKLSGYLKTWPFWLLAIAYVVARKTFLNFDGTFAFYKTTNIYTEHIGFRILTFLATLPNYLYLLIWPAHLSLEREFPVFVSLSLPVILGLGLLLGLAALCFFAKGRLRATLMWTFLWFLAAHSPNTGILLPINAFFLEHWMYLPSAGLFLGLAEALRITLAPRLASARALAIVCCLAATALGVRTFLQNRYWQDPITFYLHVLEQNPSVARAHNNIAMAYDERNDFEEARQHYLKAIELSDTYPQTHYNLARLLIKTGKVDEAIQHLNRSLEINRDFFQSYHLLAQIYEALGKTEKRDDNLRREAEIVQRLRR